MRNRYAWYLRPSGEELDRIWSEGILTVDANVLLDLYRYHERTRESLLGALESFSGRVWLSHQAAEEFFRNRTSVITSASKAYGDANGALVKLESNLASTVSGLNSKRLIPRPITEALHAAVASAIDSARKEVESVRAAQPDFLASDPVLDRLLNLFDGAVGKAPDAEALEQLIKESSERMERRIPPGYADADKGADRVHGDFLLWRQVLDHAKAAERDVVLVTSEQKEDWWERSGGKTVGPRMELAREASEHAGQRVLIYQTTRFIKYVSDLAGQPVTEDVVNEIREAGAQREADEAQKGRELRSACVEQVQQHFGRSLRGRRATYKDESGSLRVTVAVSKAYAKPNHIAYWFAFTPSQRRFLEEGKESFVAFGCGSAARVLVIPLTVFLTWLDSSWSTTRDDGTTYWHVRIRLADGRIILELDRDADNEDITRYLLGRPDPGDSGASD